ncbi:hypothetical protein F511_36446 [Dorcoceras hygrometricum]|uniref:Uncharacterized protein n=1 Tax=Dorcoceras hygrometricum TaxID=472368 RepID=A0A2Z7AQ22_9LAMI|nr:hypothetical protein F511_36446 [Dorcoceras hygrometricum]
MLLLVSAGGSVLRCFVYCCWMTSSWMRGRAAIPHSYLPAGILATMRRVVNYHSSWARQQQVELFDASGNPGSTAGRGFNPAGGAPGGGSCVPVAYSIYICMYQLAKGMPCALLLYP